ncbi:MAG: site-specific integrase [Patescibacteria group bacterium]|nr:site-specific integrase [Patescibacteria group bacterium]
MTFDDLYTLYYERHATTRTRRPDNARYFFNVHGEQWRQRSISEIQQPEVQDWVDTLGTKSPTAANRAVNMMSAIINWGIKRGHLKADYNPCRGVERFRTRSRERFLMPEEMQRFRLALDKRPTLERDFFYIALLTGARRGNVLAMRWDEIDLNLAIWSFDQKNGDTQTTPLSTAALAILCRRLLSRENDEPWVFPSPKKKGSHLAEPKRAWKRLMIAAGIENLRIHDLRRTLGSYLAINGASPYLIGKALGHRDQRSSAVYARLDLKPVREALERIQESWL